MKLTDDIEAQISDAIVTDNASKLKNLVSNLASSDSEELGDWLSLASAEGSIRCMGLLLRSGANVNFQSEDGETPFSYACASNQLKSAKLLYDAGAEVNSLLSSGLSPLDCAVCWACPDFRRWLRGVGGKRNGVYDEWPWPNDAILTQ